MSAKLRALQAKKVEQVAAARKFNDEVDAKAQAENRAWTDEEQAKYAAMRDGIAATSAAIEREQALIAEEAGLNATSQMAGGAAGQNAPPVASSVTLPNGRISVEHNADHDPNRGFRSLGDFARSVRSAGFGVRTGAGMDPRLVPLVGAGGPIMTPNAAAPSTYGGEANGADGGFLIPPGFSSNLWSLSLEEQALLPLTDRLPIEGNSMSLPKDETTPWGSNGIRAYWQSEAAAGTPTKPVLGRMELKLKKLMALVPMSDELMADATALGAYLTPNMSRSIRWKTDEAILFGVGAGVPLGALIGGGVVTQDKESGQAAATFNITNASKMVARLLPGAYGSAVWLINNDVLPQLFTMTLGNQPVYIPASEGAKQNPYGFLLGRPVIVTQHAKSIGTQGDVSLVDLRGYQSIEGSGGIQTAASMHLYFDADAVAFRATFRVDGQPKSSAAVTPANGSNTLSHFVQLQTRS
ncbi:MAG TPA: phage major capsid protein [Noviherbaspirillum sp.]|nr:phage major capsid protein [Noviherbaspirillum sp.]